MDISFLTTFNELPLWLRGIFLGLALSAPVGPIGLLCIRRTLGKGMMHGYATGLGAALADTFYAAIAAFGVTFIIGVLTGYEQELRLIGGIIMLIMAYSIWSAEAADPATDAPTTGNIIAALSSGFALTFTNPITIIMIIALVATFVGGSTHLEAASLVLGVFAGAAGWWATLCGIALLFRGRITKHTIKRLNQITGVALSLFGVWVVGYALGQWLG